MKQFTAIPMQGITEQTKQKYKALDLHTRINIKAGLKERYNSIQAPAVYFLTALINQNAYVVSGECKRGSDRYKREQVRQFIK